MATKGTKGAKGGRSQETGVKSKEPEDPNPQLAILLVLPSPKTCGRLFPRSGGSIVIRNKKTRREKNAVAQAAEAAFKGSNIISTLEEKGS